MEFIKTYLDLMVFSILGFMSFLTIWFVIERLFYYRRINISDYKSVDELNIILTRNLTTISAIGANAPYVGLLGTVMGILITFYDLGQGGDISPATIMLGLALALKKRFPSKEIKVVGNYEELSSNLPFSNIKSALFTEEIDEN